MGKARNLSVLLAADGQVEDAKIDGVSSSKLSGALPAISGANLTGVAPTKTTIENLGIAASSLTGALPAISGASLTSLPSQTENDFTDTLKTKLDGVEASAKDDQTASEIKTAYESNSDTNEFSDAEQTKLSGIATSANAYSHPTSAGNKHIPSGGSSGYFLKYSSSGTAVWAADNNTTYSVGDGQLSQKNFTTTLKNKLDGVASSANNYSLPAASSSTRGGAKIWTSGGNLYITT
jgi:hypothetical protein